MNDFRLSIPPLKIATFNINDINLDFYEAD